jgi:hypothetical protein
MERRSWMEKTETKDFIDLIKIKLSEWVGKQLKEENNTTFMNMRMNEI